MSDILLLDKVLKHIRDKRFIPLIEEDHPEFSPEENSRLPIIFKRLVRDGFITPGVDMYRITDKGKQILKDNDDQPYQRGAVKS